jgi:hypothetical protein
MPSGTVSFAVHGPGPTVRAVVLLVVLFAGGAPRAHAGEDATGDHYAGRPAAWWVERLQIPDEAEGAAAALALIGRPAVPALRAGLDARDAPARLRVLQLLARVPGGPEDAAGDVLDLLPHADARETGAALALLRAATGVDGARLTAGLRVAWQRHAKLRAQVVEVLTQHVPTAPDTRPFLRDVLVLDDPAPRFAAWSALFASDPTAPEVVAFAAAVLAGGAPARAHAVRAVLARARPLPAVWGPVLLQVAEAGEPGSAREALRLLPEADADGERARAVWRRLLFQPDAGIRQQALVWWAATPDRAADVAAGIAPLLSGTRQDVDGVLTVLERAGAAAAPAVPDLLTLDATLRLTHAERLKRILIHADAAAHERLLAEVREAPPGELAWLGRVYLAHEGLVRDREAAEVWTAALLERFLAPDTPAGLQESCIRQAHGLQALAPGCAARHLAPHWDAMDVARRTLASAFVRADPEILRAQHVALVASGSPEEVRKAYVALRADPEGAAEAHVALGARMAHAADDEADALLEVLLQRGYVLDPDAFHDLPAAQRAPFLAALARLWQRRDAAARRRWLVESAVATLLPATWAPELLAVVDGLPPQSADYASVRQAIATWAVRHPGSLEGALRARIAQGDDRMAVRAADLLGYSAVFSGRTRAPLEDAGVRRLLGLVGSSEADLRDLAWRALGTLPGAPGWLVDELLALEVRPGSAADRSRLSALVHAGREDPRVAALVIGRAARRDDPLREDLPWLLRRLGEAGREALESFVEDPLDPVFAVWIQVFQSGPRPSAALQERLRALLLRPDLPAHVAQSVRWTLARPY